MRKQKLKPVFHPPDHRTKSGRQLKKTKQKTKTKQVYVLNVVFWPKAISSTVVSGLKVMLKSPTIFHELLYALSNKGLFKGFLFCFGMDNGYSFPKMVLLGSFKNH